MMNKILSNVLSHIKTKECGRMVENKTVVYTVKGQPLSKNKVAHDITVKCDMSVSSIMV